MLLVEKTLGPETKDFFQTLARQSGALGPKATLPQYFTAEFTPAGQMVKKRLSRPSASLLPYRPPKTAGLRDLLLSVTHAPTKTAEVNMNSLMKIATHTVLKNLKKQAEGLGDPNYWTGGSESQGPQPQTPEDVIPMLPAGTFQGMNTKISPDGQRSTSMKVTPEALQAPDALSQVTQLEPGAKVEIQAPPESQTVPVGQAGPEGAPQGDPSMGGGDPSMMAAPKMAGAQYALSLLGM